MDKIKLNSFKPIVDKQCKILILGTMPGKESLRKHEYYGHPMNKFWNILFDLLGEKPSDNYTDKINLLLKNHIALWDVLECCERESSSDSDIRNPIINNFDSFFKAYPGINHVFFNGKYAESQFRKYMKGRDSLARLHCKILPSTSPANNTITFQRKLDMWKAILEPLTTCRTCHPNVQ
jgi:hypoxanthine-DNA glycosylase